MINKQFSLTQSYTVHVDEQAMEKELSECEGMNPEHRDRYLRVYRAILDDPKALQAICTYCVVSLHSDGEYVEPMYGRKMNLLEVIKGLSCFSPEDKAWLIAYMQEVHEEGSLDIFTCIFQENDTPFVHPAGFTFSED